MHHIKAIVYDAEGEILFELQESFIEDMEEDLACLIGMGVLFDNDFDKENHYEIYYDDLLIDSNEE